MHRYPLPHSYFCLVRGGPIKPAKGGGSQRCRLLLVLQLLSRVWLFATSWTAAHQASLSFTISWSLLKVMSIESVMPSNHLILCRLLPLVPWILSSIRVFSSESALCIRWPKYRSFSLSISLSNKYSGLISFRINWFDLLAVQRTLRSLLQHQLITEHQIFGTQPLWNSHICTWLLENHSFDYMDLCWQSDVPAF